MNQDILCWNRTGRADDPIDVCPLDVFTSCCDSEIGVRNMETF